MVQDIHRTPFSRPVKKPRETRECAQVLAFQNYIWDNISTFLLNNQLMRWCTFQHKKFITAQLFNEFFGLLNPSILRSVHKTPACAR